MGASGAATSRHNNQPTARFRARKKGLGLGGNSNCGYYNHVVCNRGLKEQVLHGKGNWASRVWLERSGRV